MARLEGGEPVNGETVLSSHQQSRLGKRYKAKARQTSASRAMNTKSRLL